jgi:DNA-binding IclR family transcriptional regulator
VNPGSTPAPVRSRESQRERYFRNQPHRVPLGYEAFAGDKQFATTLARGIELLRCFTAEDHELSNAELAARAGLPRPTISRLTYTLTVLGYLRQDTRSGRYALGSALISATYPLMASMTLRQQARPLMNALAAATGGHVSMGIRDRLNIVLVETSRLPARENQRVRFHGGAHGPMADVGLTLPIVGSAIGRAYLAGLAAGEREALLNEIRVKAPADWARFEPGIASALREHSRHGFCTMDGELVSEVLAVGAAFGALRGGERVVFNCAFQRGSAPAGRGLAWLKGEIGPRLVLMLQALRDGATMPEATDPAPLDPAADTATRAVALKGSSRSAARRD